MSSTDVSRVDDLARSLFDTMIGPLAQSRQAVGPLEYFPLELDPEAATYFTSIEAVADQRPGAIAFPGGGHANGLIEALRAYWTHRGEADLAAMAPMLQKIAEALRTANGQESGDVDIYCYTMF